MSHDPGADDRTLAFYNGNADAYAARDPHDRDVAALARFIDRLPPNAAVCDLGCGVAWAAAAMQARGLCVTAMDGSIELAQRAKRLHGVDVEVVRFDDFNYQDVFDGVWACWSLHHSPRAQFPDLLQRVAASIRPGGLLFFSVKGGAGEGRDALDRRYAYFSVAELTAVIESRGLGRLLEQDSWIARTFSGEAEEMHQLLLERR